jgi:cobyrinic acid a,c-diamide synthase
LSAPGLLVAAVRSGAGKTTLSLGLMRALARRGLRVSAVKCGPDYIDPAFHAAATGLESLNLDSWAMGPEVVAHLAALSGEDVDIVVAEGAMGLFDGAPGETLRSGSSASIAALTGWPIVLMLDVSGQGQTAAAIVQGVAAHDARLKIAGVVLNRVGSERHRKLASEAIEAVGVPVFGALPRDQNIVLPERHLGLVQAGETAGLDRLLEQLANFVETRVDLEAIRARACPLRIAEGSKIAFPKPPAQRIAIARDEAFSFFYPHLARAWRQAGAELSFFSPLADEAPPQNCDLCWLPGGYPELHAGRIASAANFLGGLRRFAADRAVHGECGGYMVLGESLTDAEGAVHLMAGLLGVQTSFLRRKLTLGYRRARLIEDHCLGSAGDKLSGHEFHYATIVRENGQSFAKVSDAYAGEAVPAGLRAGNVSGSFFHVLA